MRAINYGLERPADKVTAAVLCCECRLCEAYACPLELSPMAYYVAIKQELRAQGWVNDGAQAQRPAAPPDARLPPGADAPADRPAGADRVGAAGLPAGRGGLPPGAGVHPAPAAPRRAGRAAGVGRATGWPWAI